MTKILFMSAFFLFFGLNVTPRVMEAKPKADIIEESVFMGVKDYNQVPSATRKDIGHYFWKDGERKLFSILKTKDDSIQSVLAEGYLYELKVRQNEVVGAKEVFPMLKGIVQEVKKGEIIINHQKHPLSEKIKVVQISQSAGKVSVQPGKLKKGQFVKLFKNTVFITPPEYDYYPPVKGEAGVRTVKNFLKTALEPVGTTHLMAE